VGENRPGARVALGLRTVKPPADRLYGRARGHKLRQRQLRLLQAALPLLALTPEQMGQPWRAFGTRVGAVWVEVGFGAGEHALAQIRSNPHAGLIAAEVFENGICALLSRLIPEGEEGNTPLPPNLRLWPDDARALIRRLPSASLDRLFLLFPDPWPKARHAKRRFLHPTLLPEIARVMKSGAEWRLATDDQTYQAWTAAVMASQEYFVAPAPTSVRPPGWPPTRYEAKALREGRTPLYWAFTRR
jgi:tRNA (guanine-N7-)-methyltransferase